MSAEMGGDQPEANARELEAGPQQSGASEAHQSCIPDH